MRSIAEVLSEFEGIDYIRLLITVAKTDGVDNIEREFIEAQAALLSVNTQDLWEEDEVELSSLRGASSPVTKLLAIRDCISLAMIDDEFTDSERTKICGLAEKIGVQRRKVDQLEDWLTRYWGLLEELEQMVAE